MKISIVTVGPIQANCYLVYDEQTKETLVVDPGAEGARIHKEIESLELKVKYIVNTHGHHDHIGGNQYLREATGAPLCLHKADSFMLSFPKKNLSFFFVEQQVSSPEPDQYLEDGDILEFGDLSFGFPYPGHSPVGFA